MGFDDFMGFIVIQWNIDGIHPLVMTNTAIENGHRNSEFSQLQSMVIFHRFL